MRHVLPTLLPVAVLAACQAGPPPGVDAAELGAAEVGAATRRWVATYNGCDRPGQVAALYDNDAVLWGTMAQTLVSTPEGVHRYFERACTSRPKSTVELGQQKVRFYGDTAISSGTYTFTVYPGSQARVAPARFSITYRRKGDRWLIVDHHSSAMPAPAATGR